jgi:hypothetical protein
MIFTFDPPETGWTLNAAASIVSDPTAPSQPNALSLSVGLGGTDPVATRTLSGFTLGEVVPVYAWVNFDGTGTLDHGIRLTYNANTIGTLFKDPNVSGWELRSFGSFIYTPADRTFGVQGTSPTGGLGVLKVDGIFVGETPEVLAMAGKWTAISAANDVLRGIDGSAHSFNSNFEERCYSRLFFPPEVPEIKLPYTCLPLDQEAESVEYEGFAFVSKWRMVGYAFFADDPESDPLNSEGSVAAALCRDDLIRAFMEDQTLDGSVLNCEIVSIETASGSIHDPYSWVIFTLEFTQEMGAANLTAA